MHLLSSKTLLHSEGSPGCGPLDPRRRPDTIIKHSKFCINETSCSPIHFQATGACLVLFWWALFFFEQYRLKNFFTVHLLWFDPEKWLNQLSEQITVLEVHVWCIQAMCSQNSIEVHIRQKCSIAVGLYFDAAAKASLQQKKKKKHKLKHKKTSGSCRACHHPFVTLPFLIDSLGLSHADVVKETCDERWPHPPTHNFKTLVYWQLLPLIRCRHQEWQSFWCCYS